MIKLFEKNDHRFIFFVFSNYFLLNSCGYNNVNINNYSNVLSDNKKIENNQCQISQKINLLQQHSTNLYICDIVNDKNNINNIDKILNKEKGNDFIISFTLNNTIITNVYIKKHYQYLEI